MWCNVDCRVCVSYCTESTRRLSTWKDNVQDVGRHCCNHGGILGLFPFTVQLMDCRFVVGSVCSMCSMCVSLWSAAIDRHFLSAASLLWWFAVSFLLDQSEALEGDLNQPIPARANGEDRRNLFAVGRPPFYYYYYYYYIRYMIMIFVPCSIGLLNRFHYSISYLISFKLISGARLQRKSNIRNLGRLSNMNR